MDEPTVADMSIGDEHDLIDGKSSFREVASKLMSQPSSAILVMSKVGKVAGVVTLKDLLKLCAEGKNPGKVRVRERMRTNVIELPNSTPISKAIAALRAHGADAVVIINENGAFSGFFSPSDYRESVRKLATHRKIIDSLKKSRSGQAQQSEDGDPTTSEAVAASQTDELLDVMLGLFESDDDEAENGSDLGTMNLGL